MVSVRAVDCIQIRDLFTLFSKKGAFVLEEYVSVGTIFTKVAELLKDVDPKDQTVKVELDREQVSFIYNTITVCTQRTPVEVQNYKAIGHLFDLLSQLLEQLDKQKASDEEMKPASK